MITVKIDINELRQFKNLKDKLVFQKDDKVYKIAQNTKNIVSILDVLRNEPTFKSIILPEGTMINQKDDRYLGYITPYLSNLSSIDEITDYKKKLEFLNKCIELVNKINSFQLTYWDFHEGNVKKDQNGNPFLLDFDDMIINPNETDILDQNDYLAMFIFGELVIRSEALYYAIQNMNGIDKILKRSTLESLRNLGDKDPLSKEAHLDLFEELKDYDKVLALKQKLAPFTRK